MPPGAEIGAVPVHTFSRPMQTFPQHYIRLSAFDISHARRGDHRHELHISNPVYLGC